jgi:hypothetical protein
MKMTNIPWHKPVTVRLQNGTDRRFSGAYDALDFLENEWPIRRGRHYHNAIRLCRAALERTLSAEVAREAFLASCIEAALPWSNGDDDLPHRAFPTAA